MPRSRRNLTQQPVRDVAGGDLVRGVFHRWNTGRQSRQRTERAHRFRGACRLKVARRPVSVPKLRLDVQPLPSRPGGEANVWLRCAERHRRPELFAVVEAVGIALLADVKWLARMSQVITRPNEDVAAMRI